MSPLMRARSLASALAVAAFSAALACSSDGSVAANPQSISVLIWPAVATVRHGYADTLPVVEGFVAAVGGYSGAVTVTVTGAPTGVTILDESSGPPVADGVFELAIAVDPSVGPGTYPLTVTVSGAGVATVHTAFVLTVTSGTGPGGIAATLDGQPWSSTAVQFASFVPFDKLLELRGTDGFNVMDITVDSVTGPGTTSLNYGSPTSSSGSIMNPNGTWYTNGPGGVGTITITTFTANRVAGTFSFTAIPFPGTGATTNRLVTNGTFDLAY